MVTNSNFKISRFISKKNSKSSKQKLQIRVLISRCLYLILKIPIIDASVMMTLYTIYIKLLYFKTMKKLSYAQILRTFSSCTVSASKNILRLTECVHNHRVWESVLFFCQSIFVLVPSTASYVWHSSLTWVRSLTIIIYTIFATPRTENTLTLVPILN